MKKVLLTVVAVAGVGGLIALLSYHPSQAVIGATSSNTSMMNSGSAMTPAPGAANPGYKDGTYTGSTSDSQFGPVQVQAVISGGKITNVNFLQMPSDRSQSQYIASQAEPLLLREAIATQSAQIDTISGATSDSFGFSDSLQSALSQAKS